MRCGRRSRRPVSDRAVPCAAVDDGRRIGLNLLFLVPGGTGGSETYARQVGPAVAAERGSGRGIVVFATEELAAEWRAKPWLEEATLVALPVSGSTRVRRTAVEQALLPVA